MVGNTANKAGDALPDSSTLDWKAGCHACRHFPPDVRHGAWKIPGIGYALSFFHFELCLNKFYITSA